MKDLQEIINQEPVFVGNFENEDQVFASFEVADKERSEYKILFASRRARMNYLSSAAPIALCYGLEGQFSPEPAVLQESRT